MLLETRDDIELKGKSKPVTLLAPASGLLERRGPEGDPGGRRGDSSLGVMEALDELASALRGRLIERARSGEAAGGALEDEVRTLVESEAAPLPEDERRALGERVLLLATGLGPLEPLLSDPRVDEVMVNGPDCGVRGARRADRAHGGQLRL